MNLICLIWLILCFLFLGTPAVQYLYLYKQYHKRKFEKMNTKDIFNFPSITFLIPTYNEENMIGYKLENLYNLRYPKHLMQIIVVDSASIDGTVDKALQFIKSHPDMNLSILREEKRSGKSRALNTALKYASGDVIIVSDVDSFLPQDILLKSIPKLNSPSIGALSGREVFLNQHKNWVILSEESHLKFMDILKIGESNIHSTIFFEGGFSAYKRKYLDRFDDKTGSDDCGTALNIVQKGARALFDPNAIFYTIFPNSLKSKLRIKIRRANQLIRIWIHAFSLLLRGKLLLPKKIAIFEIFSFVVNPIIFALLLFITPIIALQFFQLSLFLLLILFSLLIISQVRFVVLNGLLSYIVLLVALLTLVSGKRFTTWMIPEERKLFLPYEILKNKGLI